MGGWSSSTKATPYNLDTAHFMGVRNATRNDRTRPNGGEHDAATPPGRPSVRRLRQNAICGKATCRSERRWHFVACGACEEARKTPRNLVNGAGGRRRQKH